MRADWLQHSYANGREEVVPEGDLREHVENGDPCPCMPRVVDGVVVHNSYDRREVGEVMRKALRILWGDVVDYWSSSGATLPEAREAYAHAMHLLAIHWPE